MEKKMVIWKKLLSSKRFAVAVAVAVLLSVAAIGSLTAVVLRNAWLNMRISTICPDYFSYEYAWVVDENGTGIDSAAVELWDNSNFNLIYRTFSDTNGRFVLFHDFGSFALYNMPFSYDLFVHVDGWRDTIRYGFEKHRVCHFRKKTGPDTIFCSSAERSKLLLQFQQTQKIVIDSGYEFIPYKEIALSAVKPDGMENVLPYDTVFHSSLRIGNQNVFCAVVPVQDYKISKQNKVLSAGTYYVLDRDGDNDLTDEELRLFSKPGDTITITDCTVRSCLTIDSVYRDNRWYCLALKLRGLNRKSPLLSFRRADAVSGTLTVDSTRYQALLWDRAACDYSELSKVVFGIDRDSDGVIDGREGGKEIYEHLRGRVTFDTVSFSVDTITSDGLRMFCSDQRVADGNIKEASVGTWMDDFNAVASCPLSFYKECALHRYTILYFFSGNSKQLMEQTEITTLLTLMREHLGDAAIIGINRRTTGDPYCSEKVINENRGWNGPLVRKFHNYREAEIICLDNAATIVYRGEVGPEAIESIWKHAGVDNVIALSVYDQLYADREVIIAK